MANERHGESVREGLEGKRVKFNDTVKETTVPMTDEDVVARVSMEYAQQAKLLNQLALIKEYTEKYGQEENNPTNNPQNATSLRGNRTVRAPTQRRSR